MTPIGLAALEGHVEMVHMLIGKGADMNAMQFHQCMVSSGCRKDGCLYRFHVRRATTATTAFGVALFKGHLDVAQVLLDRTDVRIKHPTVDQYVCPLLVACDRGYTDIAAKLPDAGVDVCAADASGMALKCRRTTLLSAMIRRQGGKSILVSAKS